MMKKTRSGEHPAVRALEEARATVRSGSTHRTRSARERIEEVLRRYVLGSDPPPSKPPSKPHEATT
jgi:hypothetical protein